MPTTLVYPLAPDAPHGSTSSSGASTSGVSSQVGTARRRGLLRPFQRDRARDFATGAGAALLESKVGQAIGEDGETPWRPENASGLNRLRHHSSGPILTEFARVYVTDILAKRVPSVRVESVEATREDRMVRIVVRFVDVNDTSAEPRIRTASVAIRSQ